jgi:hypothetical protein
VGQKTEFLCGRPLCTAPEYNVPLLERCGFKDHNLLRSKDLSFKILPHHYCGVISELDISMLFFKNFEREKTPKKANFTQ